MELLKELNEDYTDVDVDLVQALNESLGGLVKNAATNASKFFSKNPVLTVAAASMALNAYSKYKKNKRNTIRLFAKDAYEKKMMTDVVKALTGQGRFKLQRTAYADGGQSWVLKRL